MTFEDGIPGYVEVHDRIAAFHEKYPEGSLQGEYEIRDAGTLIVYKAFAYRSPDDPRPGIGFASEPLPGKTPYTKDSELMNCETSAWGRALAALGFEVKSGISSANEVRAREGGDDGSPISDKQLNFIGRLLQDAGVAQDDRTAIYAWALDHLTGGRDGSASKAIAALKEDADAGAERLLKAALAWQGTQTDLPVDDADLPPAEPVK